MNTQLAASTTNTKNEGQTIDIEAGAQLRRRRIVLNWSQEELAQKIGISFQQIQKYENGKNRISASRLYQFSVVMNVPIEYFFANVKENNAASKIQEDILHTKETRELIKTYYSLQNKKLRKNLITLIQSIILKSNYNKA